MSVRKWLRKSMGLLPREQRFELYRRMISLESTPPKELVCKLATTKEELEAAFRILHDEYVRSGFMKPHPSGLRVTNYHALPSTSTLIAKWNDEVVGTISIIRDSAFGFPLEKIFDTSPLRTNGARLAEISSLAIRRDYQGHGGQMLFPLLKFATEYCARFFGVDYMVIAVNPTRIEFYESLLFFNRLGAKVVENYEFVNGAPAVGAYVNIRELHLKLAAYFSRMRPEKNLFHYFFELKLPNLKYPERTYFKINDPIMTPELLDHFFNRRTDALQKMSERDRAILSSLYNYDEYHSVLPASDGSKGLVKQRAYPRFEVNCRGRIALSSERFVTMEVKDASEAGFRAILDAPIRFGCKVRANIAIGDFDIADVTCWPLWRDDQGGYGFHVAEASANWRQFIGNLQQDLRLPAARTFRITVNGDFTHLTGHIGEDAALDTLLSVPPPLKLNLKWLKGINSLGIKKWVQFIQEWGDKELELHEVPEMFLQAASVIPKMISSDGSPVRIRSLHTTLHCRSCQSTIELSVAAADLCLPDLRESHMRKRCIDCDVPMAMPLDESVESFLLSTDAGPDPEANRPPLRIVRKIA